MSGFPGCNPFEPEHTDLEAEVIDFGRECVVWITGDPNDAEDITDTEQAFKAMREAFRLGQERNDELNRLRLGPLPDATGTP